MNYIILLVLIISCSSYTSKNCGANLYSENTFVKIIAGKSKDKNALVKSWMCVSGKNNYIVQLHDANRVFNHEITNVSVYEESLRRL